MSHQRGNESVIKISRNKIFFFFPFYLVAIIFHQLKDKSSVHKGQQVVEKERQADIDFLSLFHFLKEQ